MSLVIHPLIFCHRVALSIIRKILFVAPAPFRRGLGFGYSPVGLTTHLLAYSSFVFTALVAICSY